MATISRQSGVRLEAAPDIRLTDLPGGPTPGPAAGSDTVRRRRVAIPTGPIPVETSPRPAGDPIVESMQAQDLELVDAFAIQPAPSRPGTRAPANAMPTTLSADVDASEDAVVLLEQDGLYAWRFGVGTSTPPSAARRRGPVAEPPRKTITFDLRIPVQPNAATRRTRGPIADFLIEEVRAYVFKFVARVTAKPVIGFLERKVQTGFIVMDSDDATAWRRVANLSELSLPTGRPVRILLFVHGTFSSTVGSYGHLSGTEWGREFLRTARASYDAVIGYDHASLSLTPNDNANDLLARVERAGPIVSLQIDAIAFSRGALVLRSFVEQVLPATTMDARVRRAIFVGGTNGGTLLAAPERWEQMVDLHTNLASAGCRALGMLAPLTLAATILREAVQMLGALVKYLAAAAVTDRLVPGLSAMWPKGEFVTEINRTQVSQPTAAESFYCVVTSEFDFTLFEKGLGASELPSRLVKWMLDGLSDSLMKEPNDLVVNTHSMSEIDPHAGVFVKERLDLGSNPHVYHTVYFTRPEVVQALSRWLELDGRGPSMMRRTRGAIDPRSASILVVNVADAFEDVVATIARRGPEYVIVERPESHETYRYAFRAEELLRLDGDIPAPLRTPALTLRRAIDSDRDLELHEDRSSPQVVTGAKGVQLRNGRTGRRQIVMHGAVAIAVMEPPEALPSIAQLVKVQERVVRAGASPHSFPFTAPEATPGSDLVAGKPRVVRRMRSLGRSPSTTSPGPGGSLESTTAAPNDRDKLLDRITHRRTMSRSSNGGSHAPQAPPDTRATYHFASSIPEQIPLRKTVSLEVTLSRDAIEVTVGATMATASVKLDEAQNVLVQVVPRTQNVEIIGDDHVVIINPASQRRHEFVFDVKGTKVGAAELMVRIRQGPSVLATMTLAPKVVAEPKKNPAPLRDVAEAREPDLSIRPYPVLEIFDQPGPEGLRFLFSLLLFDQGGVRHVRGRTKPFQVDRGAFVANIYKEIETRWVDSKGDAKAFERELRTYGGLLYDNLVPLEIQQALWQHRNTLKAIQVVSEEPFIPWEILHLKEPPVPGQPPKALPRESHFFAEKGLVRWLSNYLDAPATLRLRAGKALYIVPDYPEARYELPAAQEEIPFLTGKLKAKALEGTSDDVLDRLSQPDTIDLLHFSGHGQADTKDATEAKVMLKGRIEGGDYVPELLRSIDVQQHAQLTGDSGGRPMVVLNACQAGRLGWHLTELGGFAEAFLRQGAGAFVGALWEVGDTNARHFSEGFYGALLGNKTLAEAAKAGRDAAKQAGESSWLAYVIYGYPHATLTVG